MSITPEEIVDTVSALIDERIDAAIERFKDYVVGDSEESMMSVLETMRKSVTAYLNLQEEVFQSQDKIEELERKIDRLIKLEDVVIPNKGDNK